MHTQASNIAGISLTGPRPAWLERRRADVHGGVGAHRIYLQSADFRGAAEDRLSRTHLVVVAVLVLAFKLLSGAAGRAGEARALAFQASSIMFEATRNALSDSRLAELQVSFGQTRRAADALALRPATVSQSAEPAFSVVQSGQPAAGTFLSCFISYSGLDEEFSARLYHDLTANGAQCWYAPEDLRVGAPLRAGIDRRCAAATVPSSCSQSNRLRPAGWRRRSRMPWIWRRVTTRASIVPVRLDDAVMLESSGWASLLRTRNIGDMRDWSNPVSYKLGLDRLLAALRSPGNT